MSLAKKVHFLHDMFQMTVIVLISVKIIIILVGCVYFEHAKVGCVYFEHAKAILVKEQQRFYVTHSWKTKFGHLIATWNFV